MVQFHVFETQGVVAYHAPTSVPVPHPFPLIGRGSPLAALVVQHDPGVARELDGTH